MSIKASTQKDIQRAYKTMQHLMHNGWEFPDACFKASSDEGVCYETLADFYDDMCVNSK
jgi:hypothetical protein